MDLIDFMRTKGKRHFWFEQKEKLIDYLLSLTSTRKGELLYVGCGVGEDLPVIGKYGSITLLDINKVALEKAPRGFYKKKIVGDITKTKLKPASYDVILALDLLEHVENDALAVSKIFAALKPSGWFILTVPAFNFLFSSHDVALGHKRRYSRKALQKLTKQFKIVRLGYWNFFMFPIIALWRLIRKKTKPQSDSFCIPKPFNFILSKLLGFEVWIIKKNVSLPIGLTLFAVLQKPNA